MHKHLFSAAALAIVLCGLVRADEQAEARAVLDAAIKAHGGAAALGKFSAMYFKGKGSSFEGGEKSPLSMEYFIEGHDKLRMVSYDEAGKIDSLDVVNGQQGWIKSADQPTEAMTDQQLESRREFAYLNWATMLAPLTAADYQLSLLSDTTVDGRPAASIMVQHAKQRPLKLSFDKQTHLLVQYEHKTKNDDGQEVHEECVFSNYGDVQGTKQPFRVVQSWDGQKISDITLVEQKFSEKPLDAKLFEKP